MNKWASEVYMDYVIYGLLWLAFVVSVDGGKLTKKFCTLYRNQ